MLYLSDQWIAAADNLVNTLAPLDTELAVCMHVTGGPTGDRLYTLILGPSKVAITAAPTKQNVTLSLPWDTAVEIAQGAASAQRAFLDGTMQLSGDTAALVGHQSHLNQIDDTLVELRASTTYS